MAFSAKGVVAQPPGRLLFWPTSPPVSGPPAGTFVEGEVLEFRKQDYPAAAEAYRQLAASGNPAIRAGACLRVARCLRKSAHPEQALASYRELERLGSAPLGDAPAELLGLHGQCEVLEQFNRRDELQRKASQLAGGLATGRWPIDRANFQFHAREAQRWADVRLGPSAVVLSEAVQALWERWQAQPRPAGEASERRSLFVGVEPVLMMWRSSPERLDGVVAMAGSVASEWLSSWKTGGFNLDLLDGEGRVVLGEGANRASPRVVRAASDTGLPWTLRVSSAEGAGESRQLAARRNLLLAGLALVAALIGVCSCFIWRAMGRELAAARLQSDFVSAVSHEFRTPLTSMGHLTELLDKGAIVDEERRREYFSVLARETERLRRLVEGLLNFGRMEAGVLRYRLEPLDLAELTGKVTAEFRSESPFAGRPIEMKWDGVQVPVRADCEAISCALWNLVDNAAKYSPEEAEIVVEVTRAGSRAEIRVRDRGPGIPAHEQEEIFRKFVRGATAKSSGVRGAGIGLAVARHLVRAHGGELLLESAPGQGSVFTIALPLSGRAI